MTDSFSVREFSRTPDSHHRLFERKIGMKNYRWFKLIGWLLAMIVIISIISVSALAEEGQEGLLRLNPVRLSL